MVWVLYPLVIWNEMGLFTWLGVDYGVFSAVAKVLESDTPEAAYDVDAVARQLAPFRAYYRTPETPLQVAPSPHPPLLFLLYMPFARLAPHWGYLLWAALNLILAAVVVHGLAARSPRPREQRGMILALALCYFPLVDSIWAGQPLVLLLLALDRAYRAWERSRDFEAGLWSGALVLKVQYLPVLVLVLAYKRRWRSLAGIAVVGLLVALASFAVFGERVMGAYLASLASVTGFREVPATVRVQQMINWRGLLVNFLPLWVSEAQARSLTLGLSALTACSLAVIWKGPWQPASPRFALQMLATWLVTMVATYHNHIYGATLLLVPAMVLWAREVGACPAPLPVLLGLGLVGPTLALVSVETVCLLFFELMLTTLGAILWAIREVPAPAPGDDPLALPALADDFRISVVLPVYSETETVRQVVDWLRENLAGRLAEILIVLAPRSKEASRAVCSALAASDPRIQIQIQKRNPGLGYAVREGLERAQGDVVLLMDSDGEMENATVLRMIAAMERENCGLVVASRWIPGGGFTGYSPLKYRLNWCFQQVFRVLFQTPIHDLTYGFKMIRRELAQGIAWEGALHEIACETTLKPIRRGVRVVEVPSRWTARTQGVSKNTFLRNFRYVAMALRILGRGVQAPDALVQKESCRVCETHQSIAVTDRRCVSHTLLGREI
jgi:dolichol-phosphate mannosyltransferase